MSELRVDNIVSEDGSAAPIYSKGMTIGAGQTLTCTGDFSVGGNVTFDSGATVTGVVTFSSADLQTNLSVSSLNVSGVSTFSDTVNVGAGKSIKLNGASSGYTEIVAAAGSGSTTFVLPANGGSASQYLQTDGSGVLSWATVVSDSGAEWTDGSAINTSGSSEYNFTSLPTNIKEVIVSMTNVSWTTGGTLRFRLRTGGSAVTSGYSSAFVYLPGGASHNVGGQSNSFELGIWTSASHSVTGIARFVNMTGNTWAMSSQFSTTMDNSQNQVVGYVTLSGTLDGINIFNGSGYTFDGGYINIHYITT